MDRIQLAEAAGGLARDGQQRRSQRANEEGGGRPLGRVPSTRTVCGYAQSKGNLRDAGAPILIRSAKVITGGIQSKVERLKRTAILGRHRTGPRDPNWRVYLSKFTQQANTVTEWSGRQPNCRLAPGCSVPPPPS